MNHIKYQSRSLLVLIFSSFPIFSSSFHPFQEIFSIILDFNDLSPLPHKKTKSQPTYLEYHLHYQGNGRECASTSQPELGLISFLSCTSYLNLRICFLTQNIHVKSLVQCLAHSKFSSAFIKHLLCIRHCQALRIKTV